MGLVERSLKTAVVAVILNLVLPMVLVKFATEEEKKPTNGAASLSLKGQLMHMMVHHNQVPLSSSLIIGVIAFASCYLACMIKL